MAKGAASTSELAELHQTLAKTLQRIISIETKSELVPNKDGELEVVEVDFVTPSAVLAVAAKFLKDNDITADPDNDDAMDELDAILQGRKKERTSVNDTSPTNIDELLDV